MNRRKDINEHMNEDSDHRTNYSITDRIAAIIKNRKHSKARRIVATTLAGVVVFTTTYSMILPAISVELETADQVGMVLNDEGLIDEAETQENSLYPEASSFEGTGEGTDTLDGDLSSYEEPAADNPDNEGMVDGEASADIVGEEIITQTDGNDQMMSQGEFDDTVPSDNPASVEDGDLGADGSDPVLTLTASAENVNLILTYPQEIPAGSSAAFNPVDSVYYDNYYYSAKDVLEENYDGWEVSEGQFWNVITVPGSGVEVELDYNELLGASDDSAGLRYVLMDWSNEEWHLYDSEQTVVELNEEGNLGRVIFRTDALQNGAAVFGVLSLEERQETEVGNTEDETTEDGTPVAGDIEAGSAEGGVTENGDIEAENAAAGITEGGDTEAEYAQDAQVNDTDATVAAAGTDTTTVEETEDADEAEDAEAEQTEETAVSGDVQSDETTGSEAAESGEVQDGETAAGEEEQNAENAEGEPEQNVEAAAGDAKPAEGTSVSSQNETEDQPQTVGEAETTDAENAAEAADSESADGKADAENADEEADSENADGEADTENTDEKADSESVDEEADTGNTDGTEDQEKQEEASAEPSEDDQETDGEETADAAEAEGKEEEAEYPSQLFSSTGDVSVYVTAPVGAFPADTTMIVTPVEEEADIENITETISDSSVSRIQAVDIAFFNKEGKEIEPRVPIRVRLVADRMKSDEGAVIVHVDDNGSVEEVRDASITVSGSQAYITMKAGEETAASEEDNLEEADAENADNEEVINEASYEADSEEGTGETHSDVETDQIENPQENISTDLSGSENSDESVTGGAGSQEDILNEGVTTETAFTENDAQGANVQETNTQEANIEGANSQEANVQSSDAQGTNAAEENGQFDLGEDNSSDSLTAEFEADEFSIYAVVYTVDFHWEVNGRTFEFSLPGGGFVSFAELVEALGIDTSTNSADPEGDNDDSLEKQTDAFDDESLAGTDSDEEETADLEEEDSDADAMLSEDEAADAPLTLNSIEISEDTRRFVADVESVAFSSPQLVDVSRVESDTTVGQIKDDRGLEVQYSADLTEEQIAVINNSAVSAGDWALISMQPFTSEEELTVTMKNGEVFTILVTDAQISKTVIDAKGETWEITVTYGPEAEIPDSARLEVAEILPEDESYQDYYQQSLMKVGVAIPEDPDKETSGAESDADAADTVSAADSGTDADTSLDNVPYAAEEINYDQADAAEEGLADKIASDYARIFNIEIWDGGHEIQPAADVTVNIKLLDAPEDAGVPSVVHFAKAGTEVMEQTEDSEDIQFVTNEFSVYSVVYTVDFHYEVNGKMYEYTLPGGGFASFYKLVEVLGISNPGTQSDFADENGGIEGENVLENSEIGAEYCENTDEEDSEIATGSTVDNVMEEPGVDATDTYGDAISLNNVEVSKAMKQFVADVAGVEFSSPELVWVGKVDEATTVGGLKEANGLEVQYSAELTEEQIAEINGIVVESGDWALITMQPFSTEESLTVTMKNGEQFVVLVTDTQAIAISSVADLDEKEYALVNVYRNAVVLPQDQGTGNNDNYRLKAQVLSENNLQYNTPTWKFEKVEGTNDQFYISNGGKYLNIHQTTKYTYLYRDDLAYVGDVTLTDTPQALKVTYDSNNQAIQIQNADGYYKLDLWDWNVNKGFGAYWNTSANSTNQEFRLVPIFRVQEDTPFVIYYQMSDGSYKTLGITADGNATMQNCANQDELDMLPSSFLWTFRHVYDENGEFYYEIASVSDPQSKLTLTGNNNALVQKGGSTVVVNAWNNGTTAEEGIQLHFTPNGYNSPVYVRNAGGINDYFFPYTVWDEWRQTRMYLYEQKPVENIEFTVRTENVEYGLVYDTEHTGNEGSGVESFDSTASVTNDGTQDKYNTTTITAMDGGPLGLYDQHKYIFDYWDLDGSRISAGQTINQQTQKIPENGSVLTAHYKRNPQYEARENDKQGRYIDKASLKKWLKELKSSQMPLDPEACGKTAEVVDYENRIYRVDMTAKSSLSTFAGAIDLGFMIDVSASMKFPSKLNAIVGKSNVNLWTINDSDWNKKNMLTQRTEPYYIIADASGTATVCAIKWNGTVWQWKDASKDDSKYIEIVSDKNSAVNQSQFHSKDATKYKNGETILYPIYTDGDGGRTRSDYLEASLNGTISTLTDILNILSLASDTTQNPDVKIAWNTFRNPLVNSTSTSGGITYKGRQRWFTSAKNGIYLNYSYDGGTSTDIALLDAAGYKRDDVTDRFSNDDRSNWKRTESDYNGSNPTYSFINDVATQRDNAYGFDWSTDASTPKYAVLITDGAPQRGGVDIYDQYVKDAANLLKARGITLITVGLSMGNVDVGRRLLYDIASRDSENAPYFYEANTGDELEYVLYSIIQTILQDCNVYGDVTDTVGEAFYPVDKATGCPLENDEWIQLDGTVITDKSAWGDQPHGVISKVDDTYTVMWTDQTFTPTDTCWHGLVYVKAKEDFLGGNVVKTNKTDAKIEAKQYSIGNSGKIDLATDRSIYTYTDPTNPTQTITSVYKPVIDDIQTPRVNVNELQFTENNTSWTVYVGTKIDPMTQLKALYDNIKVEEVVKTAQTIDNNPRPNQAVNADSLRFELVESESDYRTPSDEMVTFYIKDLIKQLNGENDIDWTELVRLSGLSEELNTGLSWTYDLYGQETENAGKISIKLTKDHDPSLHTTDTVGSPVESYTLTVKFSPSYTHLPVSQKGDGTVPYHTGTWKLGQPGAAAGTESSTNPHIINVIRRLVELKKVDEDGNLLKEATFKIYRKNSEDEEIDDSTRTTVNGVLNWDPVVPDEDQKNPGDYWADKTTWYIRETTAPDERQLYEGEIKVELEIGDEVTTIVDQNADTHPYNWIQSPSLTVSGEEEYVTVEVKQQDILAPGTQQSTGIKETVGVTISVLNYLSIDIDVIKHDNANKALAGATFKLLKGSELMKNTDYVVIKKGSAGTSESDKIEIDEKGCFVVPAEGVTLKGLGVGTYTLTEVASPAGYIITIQPVQFTIKNDEDRTKRVVLENREANPDGKVVPSSSDRVYTIQNEPGAALPNTGGPGTTIFYMIGLLLTSFAGVGLVMKRRRRIAA